MSNEAAGTWADPRIMGDNRIDHNDPVVRRVAEMLHNNESLHMHEYIRGVVCPYCALRASRVIRWYHQVANGDIPREDTNGLIVKRPGECTICGNSLLVTDSIVPEHTLDGIRCPGSGTIAEVPQGGETGPPETENPTQGPHHHQDHEPHSHGEQPDLVGAALRFGAGIIEAAGTALSEAIRSVASPHDDPKA